MFYLALEVFKKLTSIVARSAILWEIPGLMKRKKKNADNYSYPPPLRHLFQLMPVKIFLCFFVDLNFT